MENLSIEDELTTTTETISMSTTDQDDSLSSSTTFTPILTKLTEIMSETNFEFDTTETSPTLQPSMTSSFNTIDYAVFGIMLAMSGEEEKISEFLLGNSSKFQQFSFSETTYSCSPDWHLLWLHFKAKAEQHEGVFTRRKANELCSYCGESHRQPR